MLRNHSSRSVTVRSRPRGGPVAFVLREVLAQVFHPVGSKGDGLLVVGVKDPEAAAPAPCRYPYPTATLRPRRGVRPHGGGLSRVLAPPSQAARSTRSGGRQFQGSNAARSVIL
jgi:hypothetical protein